MPGLVAGESGLTFSVTRAAAAADCPDRAALLRATLALGSEPMAQGDDAQKPLEIAVLFERTQDGSYAATVHVSGRKQGVRLVHAAGPGCAGLAEATSVVLAIVLDRLPDDARSAPVANDGAGQPPSKPEASSPPSTRPPEDPSRLAAVRPTMAVGVSGGIAYGLVGAAVSETLGGAFRIGARWWELGAGVSWAPGRSFSYAPGEVVVSAITARIDSCAWLTPTTTRWQAAACAGFWLSALHGAGHGYDEDHSTTELWPALAGGVTGRVALSKRWAVRLAAWGLLPVRRVTFSVGEIGTAFETQSWAVTGELGPELRFE